MKSFKQLAAFLGVLLLLTIYSCEDTKQNEQQQKEEQEKAAQLKIEQEKIANSKAITTTLALDANTTGMTDAIARVNVMKAIDLSQCPRDFAVAYIDHLHAWTHYAEARRAYDKLEESGNVQDVLIAEGISQLLGLSTHPLKDGADAENRLKEAMAEANKEIKSTWETIERIAVGYGATLPK